MKNIRETQKKNCLIFTDDELTEILNELFNNEITITLNEGYLNIKSTNNETDISNDEVINKLEEYFDVKISSIHVDTYEYPLIWIVYKENQKDKDLSKGIQTQAGMLKAIYYDDKIAEGIQISLNGEIVTMVDIIKENKMLNTPVHPRTIVYRKGHDEPTDCIDI